MPTQLAWRNLLHSPVRSSVAICGVAFAVILSFLQLGFLGSVRTTASLIYDALEFDLIVRSPEYLYFADPRSFPVSRLQQIQSLPGVKSATPFYVGVHEWTHPREPTRRAILTLGVPVQRRVFHDEKLHTASQHLNVPQGILVDTRSRREFGPLKNGRFGPEDVGVTTQLGGEQVTIQGVFTLGSGFAADGAVMMTDRGFARVHRTQPLSQTNLGLIQLQPNANPREVLASIRRIGEQIGDFEVTTRRRLVAEETNLWVNETPIGIIFQSGVVLACVVGFVIVYQVLSSDVLAHIGEYATLKAMGYRNSYLSAVVVSQAVMLSVIGFVPGLAASYILYGMIRSVTGIPVAMMISRVLIVLLLTLAFCLFSGLGALSKVRKAEPADLF